MSDAWLFEEVDVEWDGECAEAVAPVEGVPVEEPPRDFDLLDPQDDRFTPWRPTDEAGVEWCLSRIADAKARAERIKANAAAMIADAEKEAQHMEARFGPDIEAWAAETLASARGKAKTVNLLNGTLSFRTVPGGIELVPEDDAEVLGWATRFLPDAVTLRPVLDKAAVKARLAAVEGSGDVVDRETGEVVPWARVRPARENFSIR